MRSKPSSTESQADHRDAGRRFQEETEHVSGDPAETAYHVMTETEHHQKRGGDGDRALPRPARNREEREGADRRRGDQRDHRGHRPGDESAQAGRPSRRYAPKTPQRDGEAADRERDHHGDRI